MERDLHSSAFLKYLRARSSRPAFSSVVVGLWMFEGMGSTTRRRVVAQQPSVVPDAGL